MGIGVLVTVETGGQRLRPMEFTQVDGEWWAAASRRVGDALAACEAGHVELVFVEGDIEPGHVRGTLACSTASPDRDRLWLLQREHLLPHYRSGDDADLVVVKVIPRETERVIFDATTRRKAA